MKDMIIRPAAQKDSPVILEFIRELAEYEKLADCVKADLETVRRTVFQEKAAEVIIAEFLGKPAGFALFFHNYSTFLGKKGLYLEDLYVREAYRNKGIGKRLLLYLANLALDRECGRFEWSVLNWNTPAVDFYKSIGSQPVEGWTVFRMTRRELLAFTGR